LTGKKAEGARKQNKGKLHQRGARKTGELAPLSLKRRRQPRERFRRLEREAGVGGTDFLLKGRRRVSDVTKKSRHERESRTGLENVARPLSKEPLAEG